MVSDRPAVVSGAFAFCFDTQSDVLGMVTPSWVEHPAAFPWPVATAGAVPVFSREPSTRFFLPLRRRVGGQLPRPLASTVPPATMLLLRRLQLLAIDDSARDQGERHVL